MQLSGILAVITGGASGLGAATAEMLAAAGTKVTIFDLNEELGTAVARKIGGIFCRVNVTSEEDVVAGLDVAQKAHGVPRVLVNCAGGGSAAKTASRGQPHPLAAFRKVVELNLIGTFNCISKFAARASESQPLSGGERGVIINTASVAAFEGQIGQAAYSASKGGIVGMTLPIARDLADKGIRNVTIAPGLFHTPLFNGLTSELVQSLVNQTLFPHRLGDPAEYAQLVKSIIENPMINGETIRLDGAIRMGPR
jgi:NAD(P)-dependent dehydrogenase (short-subunit alcohol dehydrogenase family)